MKPTSQNKLPKPSRTTYKVLLRELSELLELSEVEVIELGIDLLFDKYRNSLYQVQIPKK